MPGVKCESCGAPLSGPMTFCPSCGVRQDVNLRQLHFRDLGPSDNLPCPHCEKPLDVIEFATQPAVCIERCKSCHGMFFNPGELELLLESQTHPLVWLDSAQLDQIAKDFGYTHQVIYRKCPVCRERMSHLNFGGRSGVILDRCGTHGLWAEGSELRRLTEWWRAGGKHIHQQYEAERAKRFVAERTQQGQAIPTGTPSMPTPSKEFDIPDLTYAPEVIELTLRAMIGVASCFMDD